MRAEGRVGSLKILIYSHSFAPDVGGAETYVMLLAQGLAQPLVRNGGDRLQVTVVTSSPACDMDDATVPFRVVRRPGFLLLLRLVWQSDIVHLAGPCLLPMLLGWVLRKRVAVEHHGYQAVCPNGLLFYEPSRAVCPGHFMARRYHQCVQCNAGEMGWTGSVLRLVLTFPRRWACQHVATNLAITHHVSSRVRLPRSKVIFYGIPDSLNGAGRVAEGGAEFCVRTPVTSAYVGRLVREKGLPVLLRAAKQLMDSGYNLRLNIIGDGPERAGLETMVTSLGLETTVRFSGQLTGTALQTALEDVAVVVMPTLMEETAGLSAIEQMMRGRLVIASDLGGLGEVVDDAGLKFAAGDAASLARCLQRVLDDPTLVRVKGKKARERALRLFSQPRMISEHLALYRELLGDSSPSLVSSAERG